MTTPATKWSLPSVMPEAVRNSVSMRSEMAGARAGMMAWSSVSVAERHCFAWACKFAVQNRNSATNTLKLLPPHRFVILSAAERS